LVHVVKAEDEQALKQNTNNLGFFGHRLIFFNDQKKLSQFRHNV